MIKVIFFDLDGTLYQSPAVRDEFAAAAYHTLAKVKGMNTAQARSLIESKREELQEKNGFPVPYTLTLLSFNIPIKVWHRENTAFFDPRDHLHRDEKLRQSLVRLKDGRRLAVLTNNNEIQTERALEALGLSGLFDKVFTYDSFELLKPDVEFFKKAMQMLEVEPDACLYVGDRYDVDLEPAKKLGMKILEVRGPVDIYELECIISGKEINK